MGQNPGEFEERGLRVSEKMGRDWVTTPTPCAPFTGPTGLVLESEYLPLAGLERGRVNLANAQRCRWGRSNDMKPLKAPEQRAAIIHCQRAHGRIPTSTKLIVAEGEYAMWALTGEGMDKKNTVGAWRGYLLPYNPQHMTPGRKVLNDIYTPGPDSLPVLVVYHLAYLNRAPWERPVARRDWSKIQAILRGQWPVPLPPVDPLPPQAWPRVAAFDTEFWGDPPQMTRYSLAYKERGGVKLHVVEAHESLVVPIPDDAVVILQNAEADLWHLNAVTGGRPIQFEDTMFAHANLWPDLEHNLNFGGSIYARINRWKHLVHLNPRVYAGGDAVGTLDWWLGMEREFQADPQSERVYRSLMLPLWPIILRARSKGALVNHAQIAPVLEEMDRDQLDAVTRAQAAVGWPINIASPQQVAEWLYKVEEVKK